MKTLIECYKAGLFQKKFWWPNIISGLIVGVVALPLAMAFAIASGAKPEQGIYTAIVAGLIVSVFGGSRLQIAGPTGAFIVVLAGSLRVLVLLSLSANGNIFLVYLKFLAFISMKNYGICCKHYLIFISQPPH